MTSDGSPYARFQRALRIGRLSLVRAAAAELPRVELDDALSICLLISEQDGTGSSARPCAGSHA